MHSGRFPSPTPPPRTPSPEANSISPERPTAKLHVPQVRRTSRPMTRNYAAERNNLKRAQPMAAQSDSSIPLRPLPDKRVDLDSDTLSSNKLAKNRRRVSEPLTRQLLDPISTLESARKRPRISSNPPSRPRSTEALQVSTPTSRAATPSAKFSDAPRVCSLGVNPSGAQSLPSVDPRVDYDAVQERSNKISDKSNRPLTLYEKLRSKLKEDLTSDCYKRGWIYVLHHSNDTKSDCDDSSRGYKIGYTAKLDPEMRMQNHMLVCGLKFRVVHVSPSMFNHTFRVESLIQIDLKEYRRPWQCQSHGQEHREYFQHLTDEVVLQSVQRWESLIMDMKPYDSDGKLKSFWKYLLDMRSVKLGITEDMTHNLRREHWDAILAPPSVLERIQFRKKVFDEYVKSLKAYCWQFTTATYSIVTVLILPNSATLIACITVLLSVYWSIKLHGLEPRKPSAPRNKRQEKKTQEK